MIKCGKYGLALLRTDEQTPPLIVADEAEWVFVKSGRGHGCLICHLCPFVDTGAAWCAYGENAIRPTKLSAKNWMFIGREEAGEKTAILYTIVENCRRFGIAPADYLTDVLSRLPSMKAREGHRLTPAQWLAHRRTPQRSQKLPEIIVVKNPSL